MPDGFWWRFWPMFLAMTSPPIGLIVASFAVVRGPANARSWGWTSLGISAALTALAVIAILLGP